MIERHWKGVCKAGEAENYLEHLANDTFKGLALINGFQDSRVLRRNVPEGVEFLVVTIWQSIADINSFAGDDAEKAVVPQLVKDMMVTYDKRAVHWQNTRGL